MSIYQNREQTEAKHEILRRYLVPFSQKILRGYGSLDFIDGFSGPWDNRDEDGLSDTSIGIAVQTLSDAVEDVQLSNPMARARCIFNELDPAAFAKLSDFVDRRASDFPLVDVKIFQGRFEDNAEAIRAASTNKFRLLFVDPKGYTGFPPSTLATFKGRRTEVFVNVMRSFLTRFVTSAHAGSAAALIELLGDTRAYRLLEKGVSIERLEEEYLEMLRADLGYKYAGLSPIHNPDRNEIHFNLAYATNHPLGMEVMRDAEFGALSEHDRRRYQKSVHPGQMDFFGTSEGQLEIIGPYLTARRSHQKRAAEEIMAVVQRSPDGIRFDELVATIQQSLFLRRTELGDEVVSLAGRGVLEAPWKEFGKKKPRKEDVIRCRN